MTWVKLDDGFGEHPKIGRLSHAAFRMHVRALCYCARFTTDGEVPDFVAGNLSGFVPATVDELVASGLWEKAPEGYLIHDYLEYQPSKAQVEAERAAWKARQDRFRNSRTQQTGQELVLSRRDSRVSHASRGGRDTTRDSGGPVPVPSRIERLPNSNTRGPRPSAFCVPSFEELSAYIIRKAYNVDPSQFLAFYDSNGWKVGKNPMKSWKGALYTWHARRLEGA